MMTDPIADMLTRIRNAVRVERPSVDMPLVEGEARPGRGAEARRLHLGLEGSRRPSRPTQLRIDLKYGPNGERVIRHIKRVSKPGRRVYRGADASCKPVLNGLGISHHQHQPRRDQRPRGAAAQARRRSAVRTVVSSDWR